MTHSEMLINFDILFSSQVPYYKGEHVAFDIVPPVVEFEVNQGSVVIEEPFQVAGFSVYGRVVNKKGVRVFLPCFQKKINKSSASIGKNF